MKLNILGSKEETIDDIMRPLTSIVDRLRAFRARTIAEAEESDLEAKLATARAEALRNQADEAERLASKYA